MPTLPMYNWLPKHKLCSIKIIRKNLRREPIPQQSTVLRLSSPFLCSWSVLVREFANGRRSPAAHQGLLRSGRARRGRANDGVSAGAVAQAAGEAVRLPEELPGVLQEPRRHRPVRGGVHAAPGRRVRAVQEPDGAVGDAPVGARRAPGAPRAPPGAPGCHRRGGRLHAVRRGAARRPPRVPGALPPLPRGGRRLPRPGQALLQPACRARERVPVRGPAGERGGGTVGGQGSQRGGEERRRCRWEAGGARRRGPDPDHQEQAPPRGDLQVLQGDPRQTHRGGPRRQGRDPAGDRPVPRRAGQVLQPGDGGRAEGRRGQPRQGRPDAGGGDAVGRGHGRDPGGLPGAVRRQARGCRRGQGARTL